MSLYKRTSTTSRDAKRRTTPVEILRRAYGKRPATVTSIETRSRIYCNPSGVEYSRKILKVLKRWCEAFRVPGSSGSTELRGESALPLRSGHRSSGTAAILLELSCKVCRNEPTTLVPPLETRTFAPCISEKPRAPL